MKASILPWGAEWGPSLICSLARIDGHPVGIVANQPLVGAGALDPHALRKEHDFVHLCDTFNLPLVFLHDVPGLLIGTEAERNGILHAYEKLVSRIADAKVPKIGVVIRKAYGGGHFAMGGRPTHRAFNSRGRPPRWDSWRPRLACKPCIDVVWIKVARRAGRGCGRRARGTADSRMGDRVGALGSGRASVARRCDRAGADPRRDLASHRHRVGRSAGTSDGALVMSRPVDALFQPFTLNGLRLPNRVVMAPMTRWHSPEGVPGADVAAYYRRRAANDCGLIITEGTTVDHPVASYSVRVPQFHGDALLRVAPSG